jgi:hypothetical protein
MRTFVQPDEDCIPVSSPSLPREKFRFGVFLRVLGTVLAQIFRASCSHPMYIIL